MTTESPASRALAQARRALDNIDTENPTDALPQLREAVERLTDAIDETMAALLLEEQSSLRAAGTLAGLSENAVGPRLARTQLLGAYATPEGRVTARGVERALYDKELGRKPEPSPQQTEQQPMRFKPRRSKPS
ncbi:hypothetical protein ABIE44_002771 [Marmoricola sp. OAE513]|uniref:hypothetical protein n=1 Tax=Marmoricola sp. OAE513 TaxID=2817894 RepID=UPI001AE88AC1